MVLLTRPSLVLANTLYSNTFTSGNLNEFQQVFNSCATSFSGLTCSGDTDLQYISTLGNPACISADITNPTTRNSQLALTDGPTFITNPVLLFLDWNGTNGFIAIQGNNTSSLLVTTTITDSGKHNYMLCKNGDVFTGYVDGTAIGSITQSGHNPSSFMFGSSLNTLITNLLVTDSLPNVPTPTPTPTPVQLNVPLVKQTSNPWQAFEYDTAHVWAPLAKTIHDWGCALTSAVMVLQYNGIVKMPDNTLLDPGTLNTWLKSQPDGYVGNGLVNWIAIQRFTRLVRLAFYNPGFLYDALVYRRSTNPTQLTNDLANNIPDILEEPGHFVVAKGTQGNTFTINDPYFPRNTLNDGYNNTFLSFVRFIPSHTDLSYILITSDPSLTLTVRNSLNQPVGTSFIQQPLTNDSDSSSSGSPLTMFYLEQPADGLYTLTATSSGQNQPYSLNEYLYDLNGNVTVSSSSGTTDNNGQVTLPIVFKKTTFQSLLTDLQNAFDLKLVPEGVYKALGSQIKNVMKEIEKGQVNVAKLHLNVISLLLNVVPGITQEAKTLLQSDIATLLQSL
jgi:hypothetical protein